jgi:hypothetical protein
MQHRHHGCRRRRRQRKDRPPASTRRALRAAKTGSPSSAQTSLPLRLAGSRSFLEKVLSASFECAAARTSARAARSRKWVACLSCLARSSVARS